MSTLDRIGTMNGVRRLENAAIGASNHVTDTNEALQAIEQIERGLNGLLEAFEWAYNNLLARVKALTANGWNSNSRQLAKAWSDLAAAVREFLKPGPGSMTPTDGFDSPS